MNREYIISMVIGFVLVFAGALVVYKGSDTKFVNKNPVIIAVGIIIIFFCNRDRNNYNVTKFEIRIMTITEKVCNGRRRL